MENREKRSITKKRFESLVENFFDLTDKYDIDVSEESLAEYLSEKLKTGKEKILKEYGNIIKNAVNFNESEYLYSINKKFDASELKESFAEFRKQKINEANQKLIKDELLNDKELKIFRKTAGYREADLDKKYKMLWKYVVHEFNSNVTDEEELADVCMEIAMIDDQRF